ncbi:MAG TPA: 2-amino-4-hydroxy-6-hydroxymethyldihydropteridine diphosphokinase [Sideroxyarcus sp.]|nr:2-amino-4-hydroxy-6-hydroxymethyldihydropteridine diphosphokinase [Sideroxyarcus sp.]
MTRAYIGIGSNIIPAANVRAALRSLARQTQLVGISTVYLTAALGRPEQQPYYNCVAAIETEMPPPVLKHILRNIENSQGRQRTEDKFAPRTIDLDLLVYGDLAIDAEGMRLPDPEILERPFLAIPLCELAPDMVLAGQNRRISEIAAGMAPMEMQPLLDYSLGLRKELLD